MVVASFHLFAEPTPLLTGETLESSQGAQVSHGRKKSQPEM